MESKRLDPSMMVEHVYPLSKGMDALAKAGERGVLKVLLRPHLDDVQRKEELADLYLSSSSSSISLSLSQKFPIPLDRSIQ